jgi:DNA-binding MarR family transcriptional regulator
MIVLQERDKQILTVCYEQEFLTAEHLKYFFKTHRSQLYRRVQELEKAGFLSRERSPITGRNSLIRLSRQGSIWVKSSHRAPHLIPAPRRRLNFSTLLHDEIVTTTRLRLSNLWDAEFLPERSLKSLEFKEIPDGIFRFRSGKEIAIEIENSDKGRVRFLRLLERWNQRKSVVFLLFVASTSEMESIVSTYLKQSPASPLMAVVQFRRLCEGIPIVMTQRGQVNLFDTREF